MTLSLDVFDVLKRIAANPSLFRHRKADLSRWAEALVRDELTAFRGDLDAAVALSQALGEETMRLVVETLTVEAMTATIKGLDPNFRPPRGARRQALERRLISLLMGRDTPQRQVKPAAGAAARPRQPASRSRRPAASAQRRSRSTRSNASAFSTRSFAMDGD